MKSHTFSEIPLKDSAYAETPAPHPVETYQPKRSKWAKQAFQTVGFFFTPSDEKNICYPVTRFVQNNITGIDPIKNYFLLACCCPCLVTTAAVDAIAVVCVAGTAYGAGGIVDAYHEIKGPERQRMSI